MVVHVVASIATASSGPSHSVPRLCESLLAAGEDVVLATVERTAAARPAFARAFPPGAGPRRLGRSPALRRWLYATVRRREAGIVHSHGMWQMNAVYPGWAVRNSAAALVVAPRGTLSPWAMRSGSRFKRIFWPAIQRPALRQVACWHATADAEGNEIRRLGFRQPIAVIPNGVDLPPVPNPRPENDYRTLLFLGRIHPKKGIDILIDAWRLVQDRFPHWRLVIAGKEGNQGQVQRGYLEALRRRAAARGAVRVAFAGELLGRVKRDAYAAAELYVLPTHSENFGLTVTEALAAGTPVITTTGAPWRGLEIRQAGWWIAPGAEALAACLSEALAVSPARLREMGARGRRWMATDFSWPDIGRRMAHTYAWLRGRTDRPDWVRED